MCASNGRSRYARSDGGTVTSSPPTRDEARDAATLERLERTAADDRRALLVRGGILVTMDPDLGNLRGDVLISGGKIAAVGPDLGDAAGDAIVIDATGTIVMPGLVDSHLHAWEGQLRGLQPALDFDGYMGLAHGTLAEHYRPHDMYVGNMLTALVCLDAGVTTILDNSHNSRSADHSNAAVEALLDAGIRAVHASGAPQAGDWGEQWPSDVLRLRDEYFASDDQLVTLRLFDVFPDPDVWRFAREHGLWVSSEMGSYVTNLADLHAAGLLTGEHTFNHCFGMSDADWELIRDAGIAVNVCPRSDASFGLTSRVPPVEKALELGIRPGLSMDNEISYGIDMFSEMQALLTLQRSHAFDRHGTGEQGERRFLSLEEVLEAATVRGAENCNLGHKIGSLTPGKEADVILVRTTDINTAPLTNVMATLVSFATRANVDTVLVAGAVRKWRGRLLDTDLAALHAAAEASRDHLLEAAGLTSDIFATTGVATATGSRMASASTVTA